jgi:hypothetical protein
MASQGVMPFGSKDRGEAGELLIKVVSSVLEELVTAPTQNGDLDGIPVTKFHGLRAPSIAVSDYLVRISKFSGCSDECFVLALIYIDRLITKRRIILDQYNVHRLLVTSVMLAAKFFDDHYLDNQHYAAVGGVPKGEMNVLELEFLFLLEFNLHVTRADYDMYRTALYAKFEGTHPRCFVEDPYSDEALKKPEKIPMGQPQNVNAWKMRQYNKV